MEMIVSFPNLPQCPVDCFFDKIALIPGVLLDEREKWLERCIKNT